MDLRGDVKLSQEPHGVSPSERQGCSALPNADVARPLLANNEIRPEVCSGTVYHWLFVFLKIAVVSIWKNNLVPRMMVVQSAEKAEQVSC